MLHRCRFALAAMTLAASPLANAADVHDYVPADTVVYNGVTEAFPKTQLSDAYPSSWQEFTAPGADDSPDQLADEGGPGAGVLLALVHHYYASWAEDDYPLARFGAAKNSEYALYTVGALPVMRLGLDKPSAFREQLKAAEKAAGVKPTKGKIQGVSVRRYGFSVAQSDNNLDLIAAIQDGQAVLTLTGSAIPADALATALGAEAPEASLAESNRAGKLAKRHGFIEGSIAYLDHEAIVAGITNPEANRFGAMIRPLVETWYGSSNPIPFDKLRQEACHQEASEMATSWPYSASGFSDIAPKAQRVRISNVVRVANSGVTKQLARLRGHIPTATDQRALLELGIGLHVQELVPALRQLAEDFKQNKTKCETLRTAQKAVHAQSFGELSVIARTLGDTRGVTASLLGLDSPDEGASGEGSSGNGVNPRGVVEIANTDPMALWRFIRGSLSLPEDVANPEPDGKPVAVSDVAGFGTQWRVALRDNALVILAGDTALPKAAGEKGLDANGILSVREDIGRLARASETYSQSLGTNVPGSGMIAMAESINAYLDMGLDFTNQGVGFDMEISPAN